MASSRLNPFHPMTLKLTVARMADLTDSIRLIELAAQDRSSLPPFTAGAHIDIDTGAPGTRSYSLITWAGPESAPTHYTIAVQRETNGDGGSAFMHTLAAGQALSSTEPANDFELADHASPAILLAGGIGITPMISMAGKLQAANRPFDLHYSGRSREAMSLVDELTTHFDDALTVYTDDASPLNLDALIATLEPASHLYICGPKGMIEAARTKAMAAGFPVEQIHIELFSAPGAESTDTAFEVELQSTGAVYVIPPGKSIIDVLEEEGVDVMYDCQRGDCGICQTDIISGIPDHRDVVLSDTERDSGKVMQICVSRAQSDRLVLDI